LIQPKAIKRIRVTAALINSDAPQPSLLENMKNMRRLTAERAQRLRTSRTATAIHGGSVTTL
jgi:hypothetical protein